MRDVPPPSSVTVPPPSSTVSSVKTIWDVTGMVTGRAPHEKTTTPPAAAALRSAASVQLAGVPSPTVAVGCATSASAGAVQRAGGIAPSYGVGPASVPAPRSTPGPPSPPLPDDEHATSSA